MKNALIVLALLSLTACEKSISLTKVDQGNGSLNPLIVKLIRNNPFPVSATMVGHCDDDPAIGCRVDDTNSECSFACDGTATITLEQNTLDGCHWASWDFDYSEYDELSNGDLIYRSTGNDSNLEIELKFYGCA